MGSFSVVGNSKQLNSICVDILCLAIYSGELLQRTGAEMEKMKFLWNNLPLTVRSCPSLSSFKRKLCAHLEVVT